MILNNLSAIVAVDKNWGIGKDGHLLVSLPEDQRDVFRQYTYGQTVICGRKTLATFPGKKPLPGRDNLVLSRHMDYSVDHAVMMRSTDDLIDYLQRYPERHFYLIGGEQVYRRLLAYCSRAIVTHIDWAFEADAFFPKINEDERWVLTKRFDPVYSTKGLWFYVAIYEQQMADNNGKNAQ